MLFRLDNFINIPLSIATGQDITGYLHEYNFHGRQLLQLRQIQNPD